MELADATALATQELRLGSDFDVDPFAALAAVAETPTREDDGALLVATATIQVRLEHDEQLLSRLERDLV
jgi:hypothetical protein